jgi:hypothetical protein
VILVDSKQRAFAFRTAKIDFLEVFHIEFHSRVQDLLKASLGSKALARKHSDGIRGPHFPCIMGYYRPYSKVSFRKRKFKLYLANSKHIKAPILPQWHRENQDQVNNFANSEIIMRIT